MSEQETKEILDKFKPELERSRGKYQQIKNATTQEIVTELRELVRIFDEVFSRIGLERFNDTSALVKVAADRLEAMEQAEQEQSNPQPLTWDAVESMSGKPVWVKDLRDGSKSRWEIIGFVQANASRKNDGRAFMVSYDDHYTRFRYRRKNGTEYQFYAHEPKGEHHG